MALNTYQALTGAIADWLARDDLGNRIPDFLRIAELQIARRVKAVAMETIASTPIVAGQQYYALPQGVTEFRNLYIDSNPLTKLKYLTPAELIVQNPYSTKTSTYTIVDGQIKLGWMPSADNTSSGGTPLRLVTSYWRAFAPLSESNPTNWLTEEASDLLLYGALLASEMYVGADQRAPMWQKQYDDIIATVARREDRKRYSGDTPTIQSEMHGCFSQPIWVR